ncbi:MAG: nickel transporter [Betaproteobacteria bacterium]|nr:nickel transporter [Betaproteobacteria bacterium]
MDALSHDWLALMLLVFALGLKHGLDADHLATIDGLTRFNARANPRLSRWCGFLFSLGHGLVVMSIAVGVGALARSWQVPGWVDELGAWISIGFLTLLGLLNLAAVLNAAPGEVVRPVGMKGRLLGRFGRTANPVAIALVGALFALSFDTLSQAALFALTGTRFGGIAHSALLGLLFMAGMMVTDGVNGLWIAQLLRRADQLACIASRVMGLAVAGLSLLVAGHGALKYFSPAVDSFSEGRELAFGVTAIAILALSYLAAVRLSRSPEIS